MVRHGCLGMDFPEFSRRALLRGAAAGCTALAAGTATLRLEAAGATPRRIEGRFYEKLPDQQIQCFLCPRDCVLLDGQRCYCRTRFNEKGTLYSDAYDVPAIFHVDPVEKGPLCHVLPGAKAFALGTGGCNLRCMYCQNWQASQSLPLDIPHQVYTSSQVVETVASGGYQVLAFTYTEPVVFYEYMMEMATGAKARGIRTNMVTAAEIKEKPLVEACKVIDAFTIALKGIRPDFYSRVLGSELRPVQEAIRVVQREKRWLELVTLLVPGYNDSEAELRELIAWVHDKCGPDTPLHFARFWPSFKLNNLQPTPEKTLFDAWERARAAGMRYVYVANIPGGHRANNTYCPKCSRPVISRIGFRLRENLLDASGRCPCGQQLPGLWK
ncbi:MAG: AmmeMemoRadiSam system radical SAM enzyme [Candidatus Riflebacteria bacterium]|nr:AmmeMemoRadiSam system radical SAM enzyme [Candidatus Riflebacteria bacterium]